MLVLLGLLAARCDEARPLIPGEMFRGAGNESWIRLAAHGGSVALAACSADGDVHQLQVFTGHCGELVAEATVQLRCKRWSRVIVSDDEPAFLRLRGDTVLHTRLFPGPAAAVPSVDSDDDKSISLDASHGLAAPLASARRLNPADVVSDATELFARLRESANVSLQLSGSISLNGRAIVVGAGRNVTLWGDGAVLDGGGLNRVIVVRVEHRRLVRVYPLLHSRESYMRR